MNWYFIFILLFILLGAEILYFKIAGYYNIVDKPNHRSSHSEVTVRGGGIIFATSLLVYSLFSVILYPWFLAGLTLITLVSFVDDIKHVPNRLRILIHLVAVAFMFIQLDLINLPVIFIITALIFIIGTINAINFMDGINGITGLYALITLATLYYLNLSINFSNGTYILVTILSVLVFNFFNFRNKAKCFAGDAGSVGIAFIIVFFILQLILKTYNLTYILLLLVYGLDTSTTMFFRLIRGENISEPHRTHYYQYWANEKKVPHLWVSGVYGLTQLLVNIVLLAHTSNTILMILITVLCSVVIFILLRFLTEGNEHLLKKKYN